MGAGRAGSSNWSGGCSFLSLLFFPREARIARREPVRWQLTMLASPEKNRWFMHLQTSTCAGHRGVFGREAGSVSARSAVILNSTKGDLPERCGVCAFQSGGGRAIRTADVVLRRGTVETPVSLPPSFFTHIREAVYPLVWYP